MEILKIVGSFFIQPLFLVGIAFTFLLYHLRLRNERKNFRIAINKDCFEIRHFIKKGLSWGVIISIFSIIIGIYLPVKDIFLYEILTIGALICLPIIDLSSVPLYCLGVVSWLKQPQILPVILLLLGLNYFLKARLVGKKDQIWFSPQEKEGKRGRRIAEYCFREFAIFPMVILIPGNITKYCGFLPLLHFGQFHFSFFILPFLAASSGRILKETPHAALEHYRKQYQILAILAFMSFGCSLFVSKIAVGVLLGLAAISCGMLIYRKLLDEQSNQWYVETSSGLRVVAIRPDTPAAKMNLEPGDIILNCNGRAISNENQFYAALQLDSAYCHLKVKTFDDDLKITEGAIYNDSPYELGIVLFQSKH